MLPKRPWSACWSLYWIGAAPSAALVYAAGQVFGQDFRNPQASAGIPWHGPPMAVAHVASQSGAFGLVLGLVELQSRWDGCSIDTTLEVGWDWVLGLRSSFGWSGKGLVGS